MEDIKAFLQKNKQDIAFGNSDANNLLKAKSMRCVEVPWVILRFLKTFDATTKKILDLGTSFFDRAYFKIFFEMVISPSREFYAVDIIPFRPERFSDYINADLLEGKIKFKKADIRRAPFPDDFFDLIFCISVIEHIGFDQASADSSFSSFNRSEKLPKNLPAFDAWEEDFKAVREIVRVLKPGGKLLLTVPFGNGKILFEKDSLGLYAFSVQYDEKRLNTLLNAPGAEITEKQFFVYDDNVGWTDASLLLASSSQKFLACVELTKR